MKIRNELTNLLYSQKAHGEDEKKAILVENDYSDICRGDTERIIGMLNSGSLSLKHNYRHLSDDTLRNMKYIFILESENIAHQVISSGMGNDEAYAIADIYASKADKATDTEMLSELYSDMCTDYAVRMAEIKKEAAQSIHIRKCIAYIYQHTNADLSVKGLAKYLGLNPSYLSKLFSAEVGITLKRFITQAKVSIACDLLKNTDLPYIQISNSLGFSNQSVFIRIFKSETSVTPKVYRENAFVWK